MHAKTKICFTKVKNCSVLGIILKLQDAITPRVIPTPDNTLRNVTVRSDPAGPRDPWFLVTPSHPSRHRGLGSTHWSVHKALPALGGGTGQGNVPGVGGLQGSLLCYKTFEHVCGASSNRPPCPHACNPLLPHPLLDETMFLLLFHPCGSSHSTHSPDGMMQCLGFTFPLNKGECY